MERLLEDKPITHVISCNGNNGACRPIGGVEIGSKFQDGQYVPETEAEMKKRRDEEIRQKQKPTGGVVGSVFNGTEYVPIKEFKL